MANRAPYQYTVGMDRIGFHPRSEEYEEDETSQCEGTGSVYAVTEEEEEASTVAMVFEILVSPWAAGLFCGVVLSDVVRTLWSLL